MTQPVDAALIAALEAQARELTVLLARLETARRELVPGPADFWRGAARATYDKGIEAIGNTVDAGLAALRSARDLTTTALAGETARG